MGKLTQEKPHETLENLREDIREGFETGLFKVNFNPKKGKQEHYDCTLCLRPVSNINGLMEHVDGKAHQQLAQRLADRDNKKKKEVHWRAKQLEKKAEKKAQKIKGSTLSNLVSVSTIGYVEQS